MDTEPRIVLRVPPPPPKPPPPSDVKGRPRSEISRKLGLLSRISARVRRTFMRHRWQLDYERSLNRRAEVEQELFDAARGKRPMPDERQLRIWAVKLGVPDEWRDA